MTNGLWIVMGLALLPALGNFGGGLLAEWLHPSQKTLNYALHAAGGIIVAVVAIEVMPKALQQTASGLLAIAFLLGGMSYLFIKGQIETWQQHQTGGAGVGAWMVYVAIATDLVGDGLLIGSGSAISSELAIVLALGQVLADIPEGFAVNANFRNKGVDQPNRLLISASFVIPVVGTALGAYFGLRDQASALKMAALVFVAGLYILAAVEDMLREAHESAEDTQWSAMSFLLGFALFLLVSGGLG